MSNPARPVLSDLPAPESSPNNPERTGSREPRLERAPYATNWGSPFAFRLFQEILDWATAPIDDVRHAVSLPITQAELSSDDTIFEINETKLRQL